MSKKLSELILYGFKRIQIYSFDELLKEPLEKSTDDLLKKMFEKPLEKPFSNINSYHSDCLLEALEFLDEFINNDFEDKRNFFLEAMPIIEKYVNAVKMIKVRGNSKKNNRIKSPLKKRLDKLKKYQIKILEIGHFLLHQEQQEYYNTIELILAYDKSRELRQYPSNYVKNIQTARDLLLASTIDEIDYLNKILSFTLTDSINDFLTSFFNLCNEIEPRIGRATLKEKIKYLQTTIKTIIDSYII